MIITGIRGESEVKVILVVISIVEVPGGFPGTIGIGTAGFLESLLLRFVVGNKVGSN